AARGKRRVILDHIAACFEPGIKYPERAVDAILRAWHDDYVSLRRYLIDEELMDRDQGVYWRTGGPVDIGWSRPAPAQVGGSSTVGSDSSLWSASPAWTAAPAWEARSRRKEASRRGSAPPAATSASSPQSGLAAVCSQFGGQFTDASTRSGKPC